MRKLFWILSLLSALSGPMVQAQSTDDLFLQTRLEQKSLSWLIDKTRLILANVKIDDKFAAEITIDKDPIFTMEGLSNDPDFIRIRDLMGSIFKVDAKNAVLRLRIPKLYYRIDAIHAKPLKLDVNDPMLDLRVEAQLHGLYVKLTEGIQADFMIPNPTTHVLESYFTATVEPLSVDIPNTIDPMRFEVEFETLRDQMFKYTLKSYNLNTVPDYVNQNQSLMSILAGTTPTVGLNASHIRINPVTVRLNQLSRSIDFESFKPILQKKMPQVISGMLDVVGNSLKNTLGPRILRGVFSNGTRSDIVASNSNIYTRYSTAFFSQPDSNQLSLGVKGDLCTTEHYNQYHEQCTQYEPKVDPVRVIPTADKQKAQEDLRTLLARGDADVALSVSEEYMNRLLKTTIDAKLWNEMLSEEHLGVGPKGVFVIFNQKTQTPELFLDLLYFGDKGIQRIFVNPRNPIRFALRMSTSLHFNLKDETPYLTIRTEKLLSDVYEIINGIPEYDLTPKLVPLLRKKIARMIINMAGSLEGKTAVEMDLPVFQGLGLEKTRIEVSPYGRLNLYFKI